MRSDFERVIHKYLTDKGVLFEYESLPLSYVLEKKYWPDFIIKRKDGSILIVETKGRFTSSDRTKMLKVKQTHPELDIRILFMKDNYLTSKKTSKYSDWANKYGYIYAIGKEVPEEWLTSN